MSVQVSTAARTPAITGMQAPAGAAAPGAAAAQGSGGGGGVPSAVLLFGMLAGGWGLLAAMGGAPKEQYQLRMSLASRTWIAEQRIAQLPGGGGTAEAREAIAGELAGIQQAWVGRPQIAFRMANASFDTNRARLAVAASDLRAGRVDQARSAVGDIRAFLGTGLEAGWQSKYLVDSAEQITAHSEFVARGPLEIGAARDMGFIQRVIHGHATPTEGMAIAIAAGGALLIGIQLLASAQQQPAPTP